MAELPYTALNWLPLTATFSTITSSKLSGFAED